MNYTDEQFNALAPFEDNFRTAVEGDWTRRVTIGDQQKIKDIYEAATKSRIPFNQGCGSCLLTLLKRAGRMYFVDVKEREMARTAKAAPAAQVAEAPQPEKAPETAPKPATTDAKPKAKKNYSKKNKTAKKSS